MGRYFDDYAYYEPLRFPILRKLKKFIKAAKGWKIEGNYLVKDEDSNEKRKHKPNT